MKNRKKDNHIPLFVVLIHQQRTEIWTVNLNVGFESVNIERQTKKNYATLFSFSNEQLPERINSICIFIECFVLRSWYEKKMAKGK